MFLFIGEKNNQLSYFQEIAFIPIFSCAVPHHTEIFDQSKAFIASICSKTQHITQASSQKGAFFLPSAIPFCSDSAGAQSMRHEAALCVPRCNDNSCRPVWLRWKRAYMNQNQNSPHNVAWLLLTLNALSGLR